MLQRCFCLTIAWLDTSGSLSISLSYSSGDLKFAYKPNCYCYFSLNSCGLNDFDPHIVDKFAVPEFFFFLVTFNPGATTKLGTHWQMSKLDAHDIFIVLRVRSLWTRHQPARTKREPGGHGMPNSILFFLFFVGSVNVLTAFQLDGLIVGNKSRWTQRAVVDGTACPIFRTMRWFCGNIADTWKKNASIQARVLASV